MKIWADPFTSLAKQVAEIQDEFGWHQWENNDPDIAYMQEKFILLCDIVKLALSRLEHPSNNRPNPVAQEDL